jgi:hypothetical protein
VKAPRALLCVVLALAAGTEGCEVIAGIQDRSIADSGAGASAGSSGNGGRGGSGGGAPAGSTGGRIGLGSGGTIEAGSGGMGVGGGAGSAGMIGSGGAPPPNCAPAPAPLVTNFDDPWNGNGNIGQPGSVLEARTLVFTDGALTSMSLGLAHVTAAIFKLSGYGLRFVNGCVDASTYSGISFTLGGDAGPAGALSVKLGTVPNAVPVGSSAARMCPSENLAACFGPAATVTVPTTPATIMLRWSDFGGGTPTPTTDGADLLSIVWAFDLIQSSPAYKVDITIDNVAFW